MQLMNTLVKMCGLSNTLHLSECRDISFCYGFTTFSSAKLTMERVIQRDPLRRELKVDLEDQDLLEYLENL